MKKKVFAAFLALAFCLGFWACNGHLIITQETIEGTWITDVESQNLNRYTEYVFGKDGTGSYRIFQDGEASERIYFSYKLTDAVLTLSTDGVDTDYETVYDGTTLTLSRSSESVSLKRQS